MKVAVVCIPAIKNDVKSSTIYSGLSIESSPEFKVLALRLETINPSIISVGIILSLIF